MHFSTDDRVFSRAAAQFAIEASRIARLLPDADIQHVGGTSVPGCRTKGDLDLQVRVSADQLAAAAMTLASLYDADDPNPPADGRASFRHDGDLPVGVQLTAVGSPEDKFWRLRDVLLACLGSVCRARSDEGRSRGCIDGAVPIGQGRLLRGAASNSRTTERSSAES